ncbi:MAG TPA: hypothetical protein PLB02_14685 [Thermoanaerobaculia bacterium]|nr:hypothetical protein [Thermoanaerobaculia bacterium]
MAEKHARHGAPGGGGFDREIDYRSVRRFTIFLLVLVLAALVSMWWLFRFLRKEIASGQPPAPPLAGARETPLPPEPRLEGPPGPQLQALRRREDAVLSTWGWVDKSKTIAEVPVDRAIEIAAEKGLPVRYGNPAPAPAAGGAPK